METRARSSVADVCLINTLLVSFQDACAGDVSGGIICPVFFGEEGKTEEMFLVLVWMGIR
jgi:hypothetical protein